AVAGAHWVVTDRAARAPLGLVVLDHHGEEDAPELSYQFLRSSWGRGYATEACRAVIAAHSGSRIVAETQAANAASRRLLVRLSFVEHRYLARYGARQVIYHKPGRDG
ncbi:MAG: GNAT family N-acetyltransferase, partial [Pseudomonadota bacterium]